MLKEEEIQTLLNGKTCITSCKECQHFTLEKGTIPQCNFSFNLIEECNVLVTTLHLHP